MAAAPDPDEVLRSTNEKSNFQRLARLLISGGTSLLREIFDAKCPPSQLPTKLSDPATKNQLKAAKLTKPQRDCLYPSPGVYGKSTDFDITLLFSLLRTICGLVKPAKGWDALPASADHSLTADLARIKYYRNSIYGHVCQAMEITDDKFPSLWQKISEALVRIAGQISHSKRTEWQEAIDKFLNDPLTAEDERNVQELDRWYENDKEVKNALEDLRVTTQKEMVGLKENVQSLETAIKEQAQDNKDHQEKLMERLEVALQMIETARQEWKEAQGFKDKLGELHRSVDKLSFSSASSQSTGGKCRTSEIKDHQQAKQQEAENQEVQEKMEHLETRLFERLHEIETGIREKKEVQEIKGLLEEVHQLVEQLSSLSAGSCQSIGGPGTQVKATGIVPTSQETQGTVLVTGTTNEPQEVGAGDWGRENVQEGGLSCEHGLLQMASTSVQGEHVPEQSAEVFTMFTTLSEAKEKDARKRQVLLNFYTEVKSFLKKMDDQSLTLLQKRMGNVEKNMEEHVEQLKKKEYFLVVAGETSSGKSRLVNLILEEEVLPYSSLSNTSTICELKFGEERKILAHFKDKDPETGLSTKTVLLQQPTGSCEQSYRQQISPYVLFDRVKGSLFKKIELFWPHELLQKDIVIVDSPGVGESDEMDEMVIQYLPEAFAFIYVINSTNTGGIQKDRLERLLKQASKMPLGVQLEEEAIMSPLVQRHLLSQCTLLVCNKWDQVPKKDMNALKNHVTKKLKKIWPSLDVKSQIIYMSTTRANNAQTHRKSEDVTSLLHGMKSMALKGMEARLEFHWKWLDNLLSRITFQANAFVLNASRNRNEVKQKMTQIVRRLDSIQKQQDKVMVDLRRSLDESVNDAVQRLSEYLLSEEVKTRFASWTMDEVPKEKNSRGETQNEITRVLFSRLDATVEQWEEDSKVFANSRTFLKQHFQKCYNSFVRHLLKLQFDEAPGIPLTKTQKAAIVTKAAVGAIGDTFNDVALPFICGFTVVPLLGLLLTEELDVWIKSKTYRQNKCAFMAKESADLLATVASEKVLRRLVKGQLQDVELCLKQIEARIPELIQADKMLYKQLKVETRSQKEIDNIYQPILDEGSQHKGQLAVFGVTEVLNVDIRSEELDWKENMPSYLACGAFSAVYQGTMRGHGEVQAVALKVYDKVHVAETASHVMEEVKLLRELDHPNIIKLHGTSLLKEVGTARAILVMEKCKGNLKSHIFQHPESVAGKSENPAAVLKVCQWVKEITAALAYIHERGLVHKRLLLESILLSEENSVRIADIGLCKPAVGAFVGTHVSYMAPELFHSQEYGRKADIYSLGIILWEMWYGQQAFADVPAKTLQDFVGWVDCGNRPEDLEGFKKPPILWENLMKQCWNRNPENRPTAKECNDKITMLHEEYEEYEEYERLP